MVSEEYYEAVVSAILISLLVAVIIYAGALREKLRRQRYEIRDLEAVIKNQANIIVGYQKGQPPKKKDMGNVQP